MAWSQSGNIRGASGIPGASGASGIPGASGAVGATGASGGTGGTGGPGTTSWNDITDKPGAILNYQGTWNASTNTPTLSDSTGSGGDVYRVSVGGSRNLGSGTISWEVGDYAIYSPVTSSWEKADTTDAVSSVAGRTGAVTLTSADLGASGSASASTFLRGDNTWAAGPIGATGASGGTGATGGTGAAGVNYSRDIATLTAPTTLGASGSTDYVRFLSAGASGDVNYSSVTALLSGDGTNNSTTITDSSSLAANWTASSNAKLNTTTKKFGTASISFNDTSGTYIYPSAATSNFTFGTSDFTVEFWAYLNNTNNALLIDFRPSGTSNAALGYLFISYEGAPKLVCGSSSITGSALSTSTWYHIAASRAGTSLRLFVGGTQVGSTTTNSIDLLCGTNRPMVGNDGFQNGTGDFRFNGFIDDLRITKGVARYTANFTAPTAAFDTFALSVGTPTLPAASGALGRYSFRNISGAAITIGASGSQAINGATGGLSLANGSSTELISDGTGWYSF